MKARMLLLPFLIFAYVVLLGPFTRYMNGRPMVEKLGYIPSYKAMNILAADQKELVGAGLIMKVMMYFGGNIGKNAGKIGTSLDYPAMSRTIHAALKLDPYNMDGYYFAQAILVWDVKKYKVANDLLEYGMKYRTWDWYLPFFAGFNYAYFLHDYKNAAKMYMRAGDLSGEPLFKKLAGRYLQQTGQTNMAIAYLTTMEKGAREQSVKRDFQIRINAFKNVLELEKARDRYKADFNRLPSGLDELVNSGYLKSLPVDPYGGTFYMESDGNISTTSKFAFATLQKPNDERTRRK